MPKMEIEHNLSPEMQEKFNKVKEIVKKNWKPFTAGILFAGITYTITRSTVLPRGAGVSILPRGVTNTASLFVYGKNHNLNHVTLIASNRQGPPSWVIRCLDTNEIFASQRAAAFANTINESDLSQHLNGLHEHVNGLHFERVCLAG